MTAAAVIVLTAVGSFIAGLLRSAVRRGAGLPARTSARLWVIAKATRVSPLVPLALTAATAAMLVLRRTVHNDRVGRHLLTAYVIVQAWRVSRILNWPPLVYLGQRSYGAYLLHFLAIRMGYLVFGNNTISGGDSDSDLLPHRNRASGRCDSLIRVPAIEFGRQWLATRPDAQSLNSNLSAHQDSAERRSPALRRHRC